MKKILVVEDEKDIANGIAAWLRLRHFDAVCAGSGKTGVREARVHKPALILLDINLPQMDGFEVCRMLKGDEETKNIPVIMLTSLDAIKDVEKAFQAGADDYIIKPFRFDRFQAKLEKFLPDE